MPSKTSKNTPVNNKSRQYQDLGKAVAEFYEHGYLNKRSSIKMSFLKGVAGGLGGVIGATVFVALLLWVITLFGNVSFLRPFTEKAQETIQPDK